MRGVYGFNPPEAVETICPICGQECRRIYRNLNGEIIGCAECVEEVSAEDYLDEIREQNEIEKGMHWNE